jgi:hypothetical protein
MERLKTTKRTWWTRQVGPFTLLCYYANVRTPLTSQNVLHETVIGKRKVRLVG